MLESTDRRVLLLGATGAVGSNVLATLLRLPTFAAVTTVGRRAAELAAEPALPREKLTQHAVDVTDAASYRSLLAGHTDAICTLGVGEPSKMTREAVWKIDVDCVVAFAAACREAGVARFSLMTSVGSDPSSRVHYLHMKGTLEERVKALGFQRVSLFRPSMLLTRGNRYGALQALTLAVWPRLDWMLGGSRSRYRGVRVEDLGRAIALDAARAEPDGVVVHEWDGFQAILREDAT